MPRRVAVSGGGKNPWSLQRYGQYLVPQALQLWSEIVELEQAAQGCGKTEEGGSARCRPRWSLSVCASPVAVV
jgi:hypothetical protein